MIARTKKTKLGDFDKGRLLEIQSTLSNPRLHKYLMVTHLDVRTGINLYVKNVQISSAFYSDLHYVEVILRNKFDQELTKLYGTDWCSNPAFFNILDAAGQKILQKTVSRINRNWKGAGSAPNGKIIAELTFGFWHTLTDGRYEHPLWVPCLSKAFHPTKPPKRSNFNADLEQLRQLRNRIAHHEPIFHLNLHSFHSILISACHLLCPSTTSLMTSTSTVNREIMQLNKYRRRRRI